MAIKARKTSKVDLKNNKLIFAIILALFVIVFAAVLTLLKNIYQTETYYVLKSDITAKTQVTPNMLQAVTTSDGTAPAAAKNISDVQSGYLYTKYPLLKGDILTNSNVGEFEDISTGVPDTWVVTSFAVSSDNAVQGRIKRGTYFDLMVATKDGSYYPFVNVLALDSTTSSLQTDTTTTNQMGQYVVGMSPSDAAKLQQIMASNGSNVKLILSPRQNQYSKPQLASYKGVFKYDPSTDSPKNQGEGTDYTFSSVKRDKFGRPEATKTSCSDGNAQITNCN